MKSCILLCGGMSRRMGQDKGSMGLNGKPMIVHAIETIAQVSDEIILVLRDSNQVESYKKLLKEYKIFINRNLLICKDIIKDQGPLAGILTGLTHISSNHALIIPCDSPYITESFIKKMYELSENTDFDALVPRWPDGKIEPLHSIYKKDTHILIGKLLFEDVHDVKSFIKELNIKFIDVESLDETGNSFLNINRMNDISRSKFQSETDKN